MQSRWENGRPRLPPNRANTSTILPRTYSYIDEDNSPRSSNSMRGGFAASILHMNTTTSTTTPSNDYCKKKTTGIIRTFFDRSYYPGKDKDELEVHIPMSTMMSPSKLKRRKRRPNNVLTAVMSSCSYERTVAVIILVPLLFLLLVIRPRWASINVTVQKTTVVGSGHTSHSSFFTSGGRRTNEMIPNDTIDSVVRSNNSRNDDDDDDDEQNSHVLLRTLHNIKKHHERSHCPRIDSDGTNASPYAHSTTTLVLESTVERLELLTEICRRWNSPIVVVVVVTYDDNGVTSEGMNEEEEEDYITGPYRTDCPDTKFILQRTAALPILNNRRNHHHDKNNIDNEQHPFYPVNVLRNIGLDHVETDYVLVADIEFVPSWRLDERIRDTIVQERDSLIQDGESIDPLSREAIVVPAFERRGEGRSTKWEGKLPSSMDDIRDCITRKECEDFHDLRNDLGQSSTKSGGWMHLPTQCDDVEEMFDPSMRRIYCFDSDRYEPYVVIPWCPSSSLSMPDLAAPDSASLSLSRGRLRRNQQLQQDNRSVPLSPFYDERFYDGYGSMSRIQNIAHLRALGYRFLILKPVGFLFNRPQPHHSALEEEEMGDVNGDDRYEGMESMYLSYQKALEKKYGSIDGSGGGHGSNGKGTVTPICSTKKHKRRNKKKKEEEGE